MDERYDPNLILAYVEGELDDAGRARFDRLCATDPGLRDLAEQLRADRDALRSLPTEQPSSVLSAAATAMMERDLLLGDASFDDGPTLLGSTPSAPPAGHRVLRFAAYSGIAAALALTGAVVVQTLTGTGLLDRARQLADNTATPGTAPETDPATGTGTNPGASETLSESSAVATSRLPAPADTPSPAAAAGNLAMTTDESADFAAGTGGAQPLGEGNLFAGAKPTPRASDMQLGADPRVVGRDMPASGFVGDIFARSDTDADREAGATANAAMNLEAPVAAETRLSGDPNAATTEALAAMSAPPVPDRANGWSAPSERQSAFGLGDDAARPRTLTLAIHTPEPDRLGQAVADWVVSNGGVVLTRAEPSAAASTAGVAFADRAESARRRAEPGEVAFAQESQQLDVLLPSREVPAFYDQVQAQQPAGGRAAMPRQTRELKAADPFGTQMQESDAAKPHLRDVEMEPVDAAVRFQAAVTEPAALGGFSAGEAPQSADTTRFRWISEPDPLAADGKLQPGRREAMHDDVSRSARERQQLGQLPQTPSQDLWVASYWFDARALPDEPVRIRVLIGPDVETGDAAGSDPAP